MTQNRQSTFTDSEINKCGSSRELLVARLAQEVLRLRQGIRHHRSQTGHSLCWLNDVALWQLLDENAGYPHDTLPVQEEFVANCQRFYRSRLEGTPWVDPPVKHAITGKIPVEKRR